MVGGLLFFGRLRSPLLEPEEAIYAEVSREMADAGNWAVPLRRGQPYYEKPPLLYWLIRAGYALFGVHEWAARLIPGAAGLSTVLLTFWWGSRALGFRAGLAGALILCLSPRFVHHGRMIFMDGLLGLCVMCGLALGQTAVQGSRLAWRWWLLSAAACGLGLLAKGPVALALVAPPLLAYQILDNRTARPGVRPWLAYLAAAGGVALPWYATMAWRDPAFLREFFWNHHVLLRFVHPLHEEPAWFYLPVLLGGMLPGTLLLPALVKHLCRRSGPAARKRPPVLGFCLLSCMWCVLFFSAADCKRAAYILPAMPTLALALGYALDRRLPGRGFTVRGCRRARGTSLPFWATQGVLAGGIALALLAASTGLGKPAGCLAAITLAALGMAWSACRGRRLTPAASWAACGLATFALLFLAVQGVLPHYYRKFSMRTQVRSLVGPPYNSRLPVVSYPTHWDSICYYLGRADVRSYARDQRDLLIADLHRRPATLVFVKSGPTLDDLLRILPPSLEFVPGVGSRRVTAGVVHRRTDRPGSFVGDGFRDPQAHRVQGGPHAGQRRDQQGSPGDDSGRRPGDRHREEVP
jgi:dolichol-phosphate mannosyltransferase